MCLDPVSLPQGKPRLMKFLEAQKRSALTAIGVAYQYAPLVVLGITMAVVLARARSLSRHAAVAAVAVVLAAACGLGLLVRAAMLAWLDVVSFPAIFPQYSHASYVLLLLAAVFLTVSAASLRKVSPRAGSPTSPLVP